MSGRLAMAQQGPRMAWQAVGGHRYGVGWLEGSYGGKQAGHGRVVRINTAWSESVGWYTNRGRQGKAITTACRQIS